jgi:hypothetical protein
MVELYLLSPICLHGILLKISVPELRLGKDVEGGICGLIQSAILNFSRRNSRNWEKYVKITDRN